eukprot:SM000074S21664  [mRNA]  locus=s74:160103:160588:- [translate_table: standard]
MAQIASNVFQSAAGAQVNREGKGPLQGNGQAHPEDLSEGPGDIESQAARSTARGKLNPKQPAQCHRKP